VALDRVRALGLAELEPLAALLGSVRGHYGHPEALTTSVRELPAQTQCLS
jgi:hypothetical protein